MKSVIKLPYQLTDYSIGLIFFSHFTGLHDCFWEFARANWGNLGELKSN